MSNPNPTQLPPGDGRKKGSKNRSTLLREAIAGKYTDGEVGYWRSVCDYAEGGEMVALNIIAKRLEPELQSVKIDANLNHSQREFSDTERMERVASTIAAGGEGADRLRNLLRSLVSDDRPADGSGSE